MSIKSDIFFRTKRQIVQVIDDRIKVLKKNTNALNHNNAINELKLLRNYIRNFVLWDSRPGRRRK